VNIISLVAMTISDERIKQSAENAEEFIYIVTKNATTGENGKFHPELKRKIKKIKNKAHVPVVAGFGIRTKAHVNDIREVADGVVIGSEIVKQFEQDQKEPTIAYLNSIRTTLDDVQINK